MRVAYVCADPGIPVWGNKGCSIHVQEVLRALVRNNVDCHLVALKRGGACPPGLEPVTLQLIDDELPKELAPRERALCQLNDRVGQLLATVSRFDFVYERYAMWACAGVEFAQREGIPGLLEVNAPLIEEQANYRKLTDRDAAVDATRRAFRAAAAVLAVSEDVAAYARSYGAPSGRVHVLPNAVNPDSFTRLQPRSNSRPFTIGFVGTLKPWHGVDQLINAYALVCDGQPESRLLIAGDGPDRDRLQQLARSLPAAVAESIAFLGMMPHAAIPQFLASLDVAVSPGVASDTYRSPLKLFEYMAAGLPLVAARCGQTPDLIRHGETGLLYNPGDEVELASALRWLRDEPQQAARIADEALREVLARHTWQHRCESILEIAQRFAPTPEQVAN
jgi:glycosyltransferase involved in cell wall biosynthesis